MTAPQVLLALDRLVQALNDHDVDAMVACFAEDYVNHTPAHPERGFVGSEQVRRNWARIFAEVPNVRGSVTRTAVHDETVWSEWELAGTRVDTTALLMRGVVIFQVRADAAITAASFYLEPVEHLSGGPDQAVQRVVGDLSRPKESR
jgi:hypothetical protein